MKTLTTLFRVPVNERGCARSLLFACSTCALFIRQSSSFFSVSSGKCGVGLSDKRPREQLPKKKKKQEKDLKHGGAQPRKRKPTERVQPLPIRRACTTSPNNGNPEERAQRLLVRETEEKQKGA